MGHRMVFRGNGGRVSRRQNRIKMNFRKLTFHMRFDKVCKVIYTAEKLQRESGLIDLIDSHDLCR